MEKIIEEKMERQQAEEEYHDAFDYMLSSSKEHGHELSIQELKVQSDVTMWLRLRNKDSSVMGSGCAN